MNIPTQSTQNHSEEIHRTRCEIYTRVMGYYRPVSQFNHGKKSEFYTRQYFSESRSLTLEVVC